MGRLRKNPWRRSAGACGGRALHRAAAETRSRGVRHCPDRVRRSEDGYSVIETVIVLPVLILFVMLVIQYALLWHSRHVSQAAAREGLQTARGYRSTASAGQDAATAYLRQVAPHLLSRTQVIVARTPATVTVVVHAHVLSVVPFADFDVHETAAGPTERFVTPAGG